MSMANQKQNKTQKQPQKGETQIPQPDVRFAQQASKQQKGQGPTKTHGFLFFIFGLEPFPARHSAIF